MTLDEARAGPIDRLIAARSEFLAFVRTRVADSELAEDIVQDALLRAVRSFDQLRDDERVVPWFYRILRNGIVDAYRRRAARDGQLVALLDEFDLPDETTEDDERALSP